MPIARRWAVLLLCFLLWPAVGIAATEHWYRSSVDHYATRYYSLVLEHTGYGPAVRKLDIVEMGLPAPPDGTRFFRHRGELFYPLSALPGLRIRIDDRHQQVHFLQRGLRTLPSPPSRDLLLAVSLNGQPPSAPVYVVFRHGSFYLGPSDARALGLNPARLPAPSKRGYTLRQLAGQRFTIDVRNQSMDMTVAADRLRGHHYRRGGARPSGPRPPDTLSAVLDYDLSAGAKGDRGWRAGTLDASVGLGPAFCESGESDRSDTGGPIRLGSRCVWDLPKQVLSVSLGDGISSEAVLGQPIRYGGVRIGTDYGLAPSFITQPTLSLTGSARVPSVLEIWTNQMLTERRRVPPGPFRIDDLPAYTGAGDLRAVVRDGSGNPTVIKRSFYADPSLLAPGLSAWSLNLGYPRRGAFTPDDHYGPVPFALFSGRHGINDWLTLGLRGEHFDRMNMAASDARVRLWHLGTLELGGGVSRLRGTAGHIQVFGVSRRSRYFSLGMREVRTSSGFSELGYETPGSAPALQRRFSIGWPLGHGASLSLGHVRRQFRGNQPDQLLDTAAVSLSLPGSATLFLSVFRARAPVRDTLYSLAFTLPLGRRSSVVANTSGAHLRNRSLYWQTNPPAGPGVGFRAGGGSSQGMPLQEGEVIAQNSATQLRLYGRNLGGRGSGYGEWRGALVANSAGLFASRSRPGGFAVVDAGAPDVRVYYDNHLMGHTGADGKLVVAGLRPYQQNRLRLAPQDLPLDARLASAGKSVVLGEHQALAVRFPVRRQRYISAHLIRADGTPVPAGAQATLDGGGATLIGHHGLIYARVGRAGAVVGRARWSRTGVCDFSARPPGHATYPLDLGEVPCH